MQSVKNLVETAAATTGGKSTTGSKKAKRSNSTKTASVSAFLSSNLSMPTTDSHPQDACTLFPAEDIVQYPPPGYVAPSSVAFSPDDKLISYLFSPDSTLSRKIYVLDPITLRQRMVVSPPGGGVDESNLSTAEKLRRERLRERGLGITRYDWAEGSTSPRLVVPLPGGIYVQEESSLELCLKIGSTPSSPILDPIMSPDGCSIAYVWEDEIYVAPISAGDVKQLTFGARGTGKTHGLAEYIAQEEMERRNGFWWSQDSKFLAFVEVDASGIPPYRIVHQGKASLGGDAQEDHSYPFAGYANVQVRLGIVPAGGGDIIWANLHCGKDRDDEEEYLARVMWMPDNTLTAQVLNRSHSRLKVLKFDIRTGIRDTLLVEEHEIWINLHDCFTPLQKGVEGLPGGGGFIWASERTGFRHLYLYDGDGNCVGPLTQGEWMVEQVAGIDGNAGIVYFTGTLDSPLETHLYSTKLLPDPATSPNIKRLTHGEGRHVVVLDHQMRRFIDMHDSLFIPPRVLLCSLEDGKTLVPIYEQPSPPTPRACKLQLNPPETVQIAASDGTPLYGFLYKPDPKQYGPPPYRTLVSVYGGPNAQTVSNTWMNTVDMRAQYLQSKGILVWRLDNRGTARRGIKFEGFLKYNFGNVDVEDQENGVRWLIQQGLAIPGRVGLYGWSYGGYCAAMCLARCPGTFTCAVAGAPVTAWDGYDTFYTEKYMGMPASNSKIYESSSIMHNVSKLRGKLLLVHGMIDENVHFRHTARLINALIAAGKDYELLVFPDERHMPRRLRDRMYMEERICEFIDINL